MLEEAIKAIQAGNNARARDLLARLLKSDQGNPDYWLWMSAAVETERERIYCLRSLLKIDPSNLLAIRGLALLGGMPPEEGPGTAAGNPATVTKPFPQAHSTGRPGETPPIPNRAIRTLRRQHRRRRNREVLLVAGLSFATVCLFGFVLISLFRPTRPAQGAVVQTGTSPSPVVTLTHPPTASPTSALQATKPIPAGPTPLATLFPTPFTSTPTYGSTPHAELEAYELGLRAMGRGQWDEALGYFRQVLGRKEQLPDVHFLIGEVYRAQSQASDPAAGAALLDHAVEAYEAAIQAGPDYAPAYLGRAVARAVMGQVSEANRDFNRAIELDPNFAQAYAERAAFNMNRGRQNQAQEDLIRARDLAPENALIRIQLSRVLFESGSSAEAQVEADAGLSLDPTFLDGYLARGQARRASGDLAGARADLDLYLIYSPEDPDAYYQRGLLFAQLGIEDPKSYVKATADFDRVLAIDAERTDALIARGRVKLALEDAESAEADFTAALNEQESLDAYLGRAQARLALSKTSAAAADFQSALILVPDSFDAALGLGRAYFDLGQSVDAIGQLTAALDLSRKEPMQESQTHYWRALSYEAAGLPELAKADWEAVLALNVADEETLAVASEHLQALRPTSTATRRTPRYTPTPSPTATRKQASARTPTATRTSAPTGVTRSPTPRSGP